MPSNSLKSAPFVRRSPQAACEVTRAVRAANPESIQYPAAGPFQTIQSDWGIRDLPPVVFYASSQRSGRKGDQTGRPAMRGETGEKHLMQVIGGEGGSEKVIVVLDGSEREEIAAVFCFA